MNSIQHNNKYVYHLTKIHDAPLPPQKKIGWVGPCAVYYTLVAAIENLDLFVCSFIRRRPQQVWKRPNASEWMSNAGLPESRDLAGWLSAPHRTSGRAAFTLGADVTAGARVSAGESRLLARGARRRWRRRQPCSWQRRRLVETSVLRRGGGGKHDCRAVLSRSTPRTGVRGSSVTTKSLLHAVHNSAARDNAITIVKRRGLLIVFFSRR